MADGVAKKRIDGTVNPRVVALSIDAIDITTRSFSQLILKRRRR